jgi:hypothetical protein
LRRQLTFPFSRLFFLTLSYFCFGIGQKVLQATRNAGGVLNI